MDTVEASLKGHLQKVALLETELAHFKEQNQHFKEQIAHLNEQIEWFKRQIFGKRSEKIIRDVGEDQLIFEGFDITSESPVETKTVPAHQRRKRSYTGKDTISLPEDLPVETTTLDIDESEKICQVTGQPLVKIGEEITRKLSFRPGSYFVKEYIRPKYASSKESNQGIKTAFLPESLLTRCQADESFWQD